MSNFTSYDASELCFKGERCLSAVSMAELLQRINAEFSLGRPPFWPGSSNRGGIDDGPMQIKLRVPAQQRDKALLQQRAFQARLPKGWLVVPGSNSTDGLFHADVSERTVAIKPAAVALPQERPWWLPEWVPARWVERLASAEMAGAEPPPTDEFVLPPLRAAYELALAKTQKLPGQVLAEITISYLLRNWTPALSKWAQKQKALIVRLRHVDGSLPADLDETLMKNMVCVELRYGDAAPVPPFSPATVAASTWPAGPGTLPPTDDEARPLALRMSFAAKHTRVLVRTDGCELTIGRCGPAAVAITEALDRIGATERLSRENGKALRLALTDADAAGFGLVVRAAGGPLFFRIENEVPKLGARYAMPLQLAANGVDIEISLA